MLLVAPLGIGGDLVVKSQFAPPGAINYKRKEVAAMATIDTARQDSEGGNARLVAAIKAANEVAQKEAAAAAAASEEAAVAVRYQAHRAQQIQEQNGWVAQVLGGGAPAPQPAAAPTPAPAAAPQPAAAPTPVPTPAPQPVTPLADLLNPPARPAPAPQPVTRQTASAVPEWAWLVVLFAALFFGAVFWASAGWVAAIFATATVGAAGAFGLWQWGKSKD